MEMNSYRKCSGIKKAKTRCVSPSAGSKPLGEESFNILKSCLVELLWQHLAADTLVMAFSSGSFFALALSCWLLVKLARAQVGQEAVFLNGAFETA